MIRAATRRRVFTLSWSRTWPDVAEIGWRAISPAKEFGTGGSGKGKGHVAIPIESVTLRSRHFLLPSIRILPRRMYSRSISL